METVVIYPTVKGNEKRLFANRPIAIYWLENNYDLVEFKQVDDVRIYKTQDGYTLQVKPAKWYELFPNINFNDGFVLNCE